MCLAEKVSRQNLNGRSHCKRVSSFRNCDICSQEFPSQAPRVLLPVKQRKVATALLCGSNGHLTFAVFPETEYVHGSKYKVVPASGLSMTVLPD